MSGATNYRRYILGKIFSTNLSVKLQIILTYLNMSKIFLNLYLLKKICIHNRYQHVIKSAFSIFKSSIIYVNLSEQKPNYSNEKNQYRQTSSKPDKFNPYKPSGLSTDIGVAPITQHRHVRNKNRYIQRNLIFHTLRNCS